MPTLKEIAKLAGLTKMGVYNRVKAISKSSPDFARKHLTFDVNHNNMIEVDDDGVDIIEEYANQHKGYKQSTSNNSANKDKSTNDYHRKSENSSRSAVLKIQIDSLKSLIKSKDDNIRGKEQDIHDKKVELASVHRDLANTQQLLKREQDLDVSRSQKYENRIKDLNSKLKKLPSAKSHKQKNKASKKSFWQRFF